MGFEQALGDDSDSLLRERKLFQGNRVGTATIYKLSGLFKPFVVANLRCQARLTSSFTEPASLLTWVRDRELFASNSAANISRWRGD